MDSDGKVEVSTMNLDSSGVIPSRPGATCASPDGRSLRGHVLSFRPQHFLTGMALLIARWLALVWYLPAYPRAEAFYRVKRHP
jgi:hypothetical protein